MHPQAAGSSTPSSPPAAPRHVLVLCLITLTVAVFVGLFAILYIRWARFDEPSSMLVVAVTPAFDGAEIEVGGMELPMPHRVIVSSGKNRLIPFYLYRGNYTLRVSRDEKAIYTSEFFISPKQLRRLNLQPLEHLLPPPSATAPTTPQINSRP